MSGNNPFILPSKAASSSCPQAVSTSLLVTPKHLLDT